MQTINERLSAKAMSLVGGHVTNDMGLHWLSNEKEIRSAKEFKKHAFVSLRTAGPVASRSRGEVEEAEAIEA